MYAYKKNRLKRFQKKAQCLPVIFKIAVVCGLLLLPACAKEPTPVVGHDMPAEGATAATEEKQGPAEGGLDEANGTVVGDRLTIKRGLVAKMVALTYNDLPSVKAMDREIDFVDTTGADWYDKYINTVGVQKYMLGEEGMFKPESPLTIGEAQTLLDRLDKNNNVKMKITEETRDKPISYALWIELYKGMLGNVSGNNVKEVFNIEEKELIILASPDNNENLTGYSLISDIGAYSYEGIEASYYIDKKIQVLLKNNEIIAVVGVIDENPVIENCFIVQNTGQEITIFSGGVERTYLFNNSGGDLANKICDLRIHEDGAEITNLYEEAITGKILKVTGAVAEFEGVGTKKLAQRAKVYSTADGDVTWKGPSSLIVGSDIAYYFMNGDEIRAAVIIKNQIPENIRVAISNTGYTSLYHDTVEITSEEGFSAFLGGDESYYGPGEIYSPVLDNGGRVFIKPSVGGKIIINSIRRNWPGGAAPAYRGTVEVSKEGGKYVIVNEAPFEEYLYAVIPSEMPTSFGLEAAKVQAVTARSYAHNQFLENKYHEYGANIDDSVNSQVYNNIPENESSVIAVDETNGVFITHQGKVVSANFFSTSAGYTANSGEIWADATTKQFPGDTPPYLTAAGQFEGAGFGDLSIEENAIKFFKDPDVECFEKGAPWFRWNVEMTAEEISNSVNSNLAARYKANPSLIKTLQEDGYYRTKGIESVGKITNMQVIKRGEAGNIMQLKLSGTEASIMVYTEYNIRMLLKPSSPGKEITLNLDGGDIVENYSLMPSSFFVFDKYVDADGNLTRVVFYGGGNGHGVGMSQTGVRALIGLGYDFESIIKHYFAGVELSAISG